MSSADHRSRRRLFGSLAVALILVVDATLGCLTAIAGGSAGAAGSATQLAYTTSPSSVVAGAVMTAPVVQLRDSGNNNVMPGRESTYGGPQHRLLRPLGDHVSGHQLPRARRSSPIWSSTPPAASP